MVDNVDPDSSEPMSQLISPDGKKIVYQHDAKVFVRELDEWEAREITVAEGAEEGFWSHDGEHLAYTKDERLWRVAADGSDHTAICDLPWEIEGGTWGPDGTIVLASDRDGLFSVSSRGGELKEMHPKDEGLRDYHHPSFLPDGRSILVALHRDSTMSIALIAGGESRTLVEYEGEWLRGPVYSPSGHVLYSRAGTNDGIWALPFSPDRLEPTGEPFLVVAEAGRPSISRDGTLVYGVGGGTDMRQLVWVDRQGQVLETIGQPQNRLARPALSPDGRRIAVSAGESTERDIWIHDIARHTRTRLTFDEANEDKASWVPGTDRIAFTRFTDDGPRIMITDADGSGQPEPVVEGDAFDYSSDGKFLLFDVESEKTDWDVWYLPLQGGGEAVPIVQTEHAEGDGRLSPDGNYMAYTSEESGRNEIYLKRFPSGEGKWQVSVDGGARPKWSPEGDELFWINDGALMAVDVETGPTPRLGTPRRLFGWRPAWMLTFLRFDVAADAQRFLLIAPENRAEIVNAIRVVENWWAEFDED
jgi:serine/threonine-protein kinase